MSRGNYDDKRRDVKRRYRKKALQTGMSQVGDAASALPPPFHSYSTTTHTQTQPVRPGIDPQTYKRDVRPAVEHLDSMRPLNQSNYPWHLIPLGDAANVIQRQRFDLTTLAGALLAPGEWIDVLVLNVNFQTGSNTWTGGIPIVQTTPSLSTAPTLPLVSTPVVQPKPASVDQHPNAEGSTFVPTVGSSSVTNTVPIGEYYKIASFGQTEPDGPASPITQLIWSIWIDGNLFMSWTGFQWSAVLPVRDQWIFEQPLTVERQIVLRVENPTGSGADCTGNIDGAFVGWSEQMTGYFDISHQQLQSV